MALMCGGLFWLVPACLAEQVVCCPFGFMCVTSGLSESLLVWPVVAGNLSGAEVLELNETSVNEERL